MGVDAGTPPGLADRIRQIAEQEVRKFARSGFLRNSSISDGGLTIKGGFLRLLSKATGGVTLFYLGPSGDTLGNGERQQVWIVKRADGTNVLDLYDAFPDQDGTLNQALSWRDRTGNTVFADDTDSGQGLARPYLGTPFYRARDADWLSTTSTEWSTLFRAKLPKQQPSLFARVWAAHTAAGASGQLRVMVNGQQLGSTVITDPAAVTEYLFGPGPVPGDHMAGLSVEIQARMVSGSGGLKVEPSQLQGQQT
ncbi:hypothetical protein IN07_03340 [Modestobacter caceresii]|uniref:Uncharacterized protein n=1 Tax=Modestobacter caceresii TaxID=1522368 RepID=A0A098YCQ9_9ACTN|nr:hypothetical protein [Modestobacter caceresii]KGH48249.1 hypothetical protein IN07_03340 [Modestobacter caceresii]